MSQAPERVEDSAEDLFENAPCGYITTRLDGTILKVNRTFEEWTGLRREDLIGARRFQQLLSPGGRIYHETHYAPLLRMQGAVREIAVEIVRADGSRLPALVNSVLRSGDSGEPEFIRTTVFDATDRRRYEEELLRARREQEGIALQLQRSLLAGELPAAPEIELEVSYRAAIRGTEAGGDWYDAFWLEPERTLALVVGDVMGRGIAAATKMGQLRSAVRALASTGLAPAPLLDALDVYSRRHGLGLMTTIVYAELEVGTRELRYACAGHPPPVLDTPGEAPQLLWEGRSPPVEVVMRPPALRVQATCTLPPGATIVLYTDGLVERRSEPLNEGLDRLLAAVAAHHGEPPATLLPGILREVSDLDGSDDVCVLALRLS